MSRPVILVATTNPAMALALEHLLATPCRDLGLRLEICPGARNPNLGAEEAVTSSRARVHAYDSAEALFDELASRCPRQLADTLVIVDVGADLEGSFAPAATLEGKGWNVASVRLLGVAAELVLGFPQVFPVILSPAVILEADASSRTNDVSTENGGGIGDLTPATAGWRSFQRFRNELYKLDGISTSSDGVGDISCHFANPLDDGSALKTILQRFAYGMRSWFDPTGLRTLVRNRCLGSMFGTDHDWEGTKRQRDALLARLRNVVVAVDEERTSAAFNAYAVYKHGCRAWMVTTYRELAKEPIWNQCSKDENALVVRDIDLRFPDVPQSSTKNTTSVRDQLSHVGSDQWKVLLEGGPWRVRVVSGHDNVDDCNGPGSDNALNHGEYPCSRTAGTHYIGLRKPVGSMYRLCELFEHPPESVASQIDPVAGGKTPAGTHGAKYSNLTIAESLLTASRRCHGDPVTNLLGGLLAMEAYELLLGMSRTTVLTALTEQHKHEVAAEVEFPGVAHAMTIAARRIEVEATVRRLNGASKQGDSISAGARVFLSQFWDVLRVVYRQGEEFGAAEEAGAESLVYGRWWKLSVKATSRPLTEKGVKWKRRVVGVATSMPYLAAAHALWIIAMSLAYGGVGLWSGMYSSSLSWDGLKGGVVLVLSVGVSSLAMQPDGEVEELIKTSAIVGRGLVGLHLLMAYVLFGILISMLYRRVTRS